MAWLCSAACPRIEAREARNDDEQIGVDIVKRAIEYPLRALADNAGVEGSVIVQEVKKRKGNEGYNVATGEYEDLVKAGVVDPKKVTRTALQNAASIAGLLLTTECLITEMPEKEKPAPARRRPRRRHGRQWITKPVLNHRGTEDTQRGWRTASPAFLFALV